MHAHPFFSPQKNCLPSVWQLVTFPSVHLNSKGGATVNAKLLFGLKGG